VCGLGPSPLVAAQTLPNRPFVVTTKCVVLKISQRETFQTIPKSLTKNEFLLGYGDALFSEGAHGSAGTMLQAGRSRVRFTMSFPIAHDPGFDSASNMKEYQVVS
jgi:hypothetical protein